MKKTHSQPVIGLLLSFSTLGMIAGELTLADDAEAKSSKKKKNQGDWCEALEDLGKLYKDKDNQWIQKVTLSGRIHEQWGATDGKLNQRAFSGQGYELRRLRMGVDIEFLDDFKLSTSANYNRGGFRDTQIGYAGLDQMTLEYDLGDLGKLDKVELGFGRYKLGFGGEEMISSNDIKTIERSALNDEFAGERVTGVKGSFEVGDNIDFLWGVYSTAYSERSFANWDKGILYHLGSDFDLFDGHLDIQGLYADAIKVENEVFDYRWAISSTYDNELGVFDVMTNVTYGEDYKNQAVYGIVIMPSTELIKNKLEAVARFQWAHSEDGDLNPQKRNTRPVAFDDFGFKLPSGRYNQNFYVGLNYFFCEDHAKAMIGIEHEKNRGILADTEATTLWSAMRINF